MEEQPRKPRIVIGAGLLVLLLSAYLAGLWTGQGRLRRAQDEANRCRLLAESEQAIRRRDELRRQAELEEWLHDHRPGGTLRVPDELERGTQMDAFWNRARWTRP